MLTVHEILGDAGDARWADREVDELPVRWGDATKRRLRATTAGGVDVALDLPRGSFLAHGAVLHDSGAAVIVVARTREPAMVVRFAGDPSWQTVEAAARIGHAFGNQHVHFETGDAMLVVPITTSESVVRATIAALHVEGVIVEREDVRMATDAPLGGGGDQGHHHHPAP